jgi:argininosuccinate lyase
MTKLWGGRFAKTAAEWVDEFGASISFDRELVEEDIQGSLAHVRMLKKCNILTGDEAEQIETGLETLLEKAKQGELEYSASEEDIHMNLEKMLIDEIGPVGG